MDCKTGGANQIKWDTVIISSFLRYVFIDKCLTKWNIHKINKYIGRGTESWNISV